MRRRGPGLRAVAGPLGSEDAHVDSVNVPAVAVHMLPEAALLDESTGQIGSDRALVVGMDPEPDPAEVPVAKRVLDEKIHSFPAIAAPPVILVADADAEFGGTGRLVEVMETALADERAVDLDGEPGTVSPALATGDER